MVNLEQAESLIKEMSCLLVEERIKNTALQAEIDMLKSMLDAQQNREYDV